MKIKTKTKNPILPLTCTREDYQKTVFMKTNQGYLTDRKALKRLTGDAN